MFESWSKFHISTGTKAFDVIKDVLNRFPNLALALNPRGGLFETERTTRGLQNAAFSVLSKCNIFDLLICWRVWWSFIFMARIKLRVGHGSSARLAGRSRGSSFRSAWHHGTKMVNLSRSCAFYFLLQRFPTTMFHDISYNVQDCKIY